MKKDSFLYRNSLSIVMLLLFVISLAGQTYTGWKEYADELMEKGGAPVSFTYYLTTGHFYSAIFENWQSEFLQMTLYVLFTVFLRQKGSSESKKLNEKEEVDRDPIPKPGAPWPVRKGGFILKLYSHSLSIAFFILFLLSISLHAWGSLKEYNVDQSLMGEPQVTMGQYLTDTKFWFETFQNWQSEFISVFSIVVLSIFLREKGSPESKPVDASNEETGD